MLCLPLQEYLRSHCHGCRSETGSIEGLLGLIMKACLLQLYVKTSTTQCFLEVDFLNFQIVIMKYTFDRVS